MKYCHGRFRSGIEYSLKAADALRKGGYWNLDHGELLAYGGIMAMNIQGNFTTALKYAQDLGQVRRRFQ